jgi:GT2 family glycosyltransferase
MTAPVTVAVVSWNTRDLLERCLRSLAPDADSGRAAVWVVDNASSDGSADLVRDSFPWAELVAARENLGFGPAVNEVARRTEGDWLAPSNADVELVPGALEALLAAGERDPGAGLVAPRLVQADGATQHSVHPFPTVAVSVVLATGLPRLAHGLGDRLCLDGYWDPSRPRYVDWAHGAFLLARRSAFEAAGGFDERQWMFAEDLDLAWRLRLIGARTRYEPAAVAHHAVAAATAPAFGGGREARHMEAAYSWMARRRGIAVTRAFAAVNLAAAAARVAVLRPLAVAWPGRFRAGRDRALRFARLHRIGLRPRRRLHPP